jgi:hypothetical protein
MIHGQLLHAQNKIKIENVQSIYLRNSGPIYANKEIKGYFFFYQSDKINKKENEYTLKLTDQNLNPAREIKFTDSKDVVLLESAYNGNDLIFQFYNSKDSYLEYKIYGMDGRLKNSYTREFDKKTKNFFEQTKENQEDIKSIFPLGSAGFASVVPVRDGNKYTYEVNFLLSDRKKQITYSPGDEDRFSQAQYIGSTDSVLLIQVMKKSRLMSNDLESWLVGFNAFTGKKTFEMETIKDQNFYPMNVAMIRNGDGKFMLLGPYFNKEDRAARDRSLGLGVWVMDARGKVVSQKYNPWDGNLSKFLKVDAKGKVDKIGYVYFHSILQTSNGKIFAIGEGYKKQVSAGGIAMNVLSQRGLNSMAKIQTTDMVLLQFDPEFNITDAKVYDKFSNSVGLPAGAEYLNAPSLALLVKTIGGFDYEYTQTDNEADEFLVGYTDYEKDKDFKGLTFNTIHYDGAAISTDKIVMESKASSMRILPAKIGSVMVMEYFKKDKKLDLHIEKMD